MLLHLRTKAMSISESILLINNLLPIVLLLLIFIYSLHFALPIQSFRSPRIILFHPCRKLFIDDFLKL